MALHTVGGVGVAMGSILPRVDSIAPPPKLGTLRCDVCATWASDPTPGRKRVRVLRFSLVRSIDVAGRHTTRGAGAIQLCERCWSHGPAKRQHRSRKAA